MSSAAMDLDKIPTGIEGFEHITMGGLPKGRTCLVSGSSGSGKTILAMEFLYRGITLFGRKGIFVTMEERVEDLIRNVRKMDWDLQSLVNEGRLRFVDATPEPEPLQESGPYDLSGLLTRIQHAVETTGAELLVMDSLGSLFGQFSSPSTVRREIFRITASVKEMGITALLTAEREGEYGPISRFGVEEFVSDTVIILRNVLKEEKCRRTIQVLKMRGESHFKGEYPFTINTHSGISILPLSARELKQSSSTHRVSFGNRTLDQMAGGGLFRDSIFLVSGPTGGGKTLLATTFAADGCSHGEKVLLLAYEESRAQLLRNAQSWGMDFRKWEEDGLLKVVCQYPEAMGLEDHLLLIQREIEQFRPKRLIMDSVSAMERVGPVRFFREFVIGLTSFAKQEEVCSLFTSTTPKLSGGDSITEAHISTITDAILLLRYVEINGILRRGIAVIKMRGSQHDKQIREFTIDNQGLHIGKPFTNVQNIILGVPSATAPSEGEELESMFGVE
ncbi:MAG: circadian clock protein KaiC [Magnetococcales bacterium]|nr:circadian clock protein KaiC [Magnetococcales bacterium]